MLLLGQDPYSVETGSCILAELKPDPSQRMVLSFSFSFLPLSGALIMGRDTTDLFRAGMGLKYTSFLALSPIHTEPFPVHAQLWLSSRTETRRQLCGGDSPLPPLCGVGVEGTHTTALTQLMPLPAQPSRHPTYHFLILWG